MAREAGRSLRRGADEGGEREEGMRCMDSEQKEKRVSTRRRERNCLLESKATNGERNEETSWVHEMILHNER